MDRKEFIRQLSLLLEDIPEAERREAMDFYNSYFDDAGPERESQVIQELGGTPQKAAASIKAEFLNGRQDYGEYTERGYRDTRIPNKGQMPQPLHEKEPDKGGGKRRGAKKRQKLTKVILAILVLAAGGSICLRLMGGLVEGTFSLLGWLARGAFSLVGWLAALVFGVAAAVFALFIGGVALAAVGIAKCVTNPPLGLLAIGLGLFLLGIGVLLLLLYITLAVKVLPRFFRWLHGHLDSFFRWCRMKWTELRD